MILSFRRSARVLAGLVAVAALVFPAALAWGCVAVVSLTNSTRTVQPGGTVSVTGREFAMNVPVTIHLDSPTGPILATAPPPSSTMNSSFTIDVPIPGNISTGQHFLVAKQDHHDMNSGQPARTVFHVGAAPPTPAAPRSRPVALEVGSGPSATSLILIGLGVMVVGLAASGAWAVASKRRGAGPGASTGGAEPVSAS